MSAGTITETSKVFKIQFRYNPHLVERIKDIEGRRWDGVSKCWTVPITEREAVKKFAEKYKFSLGDLQEDEKVYPIPPMPELKIDIPLKRKLFAYQSTGVAYALEKKRIIIGDQPGLGKTGQSIATVTADNQFPCLVICPSSLKINWQREWQIWTDHRAMILQDSIKNTFHRYYEAGMADVFIVNYESLKKYFVDEMPKGKKRITLKDIKFKERYVNMFKSVVVDESHRCKSFSTQQTKFVKGIAQGKEMILCLTGTPVINNPQDLLPQLGIIDQLSKFGGYKGFVNRYCAGATGASNLKELNAVLNIHCFYRRDKSEVLKDLPAKMRQVILCDITTRKEYADAENNLIAYLKKYKNADDEKIERSLRGEIMVTIGILKDISARGKLDDAFEFIDEVLGSGEKLVVFAHLKDVINKVKAKYPDAVTVTGSDDAASRQNAVDSFQNNPACKLIICSIMAAGVGLTLTASSRVMFIELAWTAASHEQCEDRCHRIGQQDSVQCTYLIGNNTIDQHIYNIINTKRDIANKITGAEDQVEENVINNLISLFSENRGELEL